MARISKKSPTAVQANRSHDFRHLIRRWRAVLRPTGYVLRKFGTAADLPLHYAEPRRPRSDQPWIYLSAGIHGDEPAATEGLLTWAERHPADLARFNFLLFPCLNPFGLINNCRTDADGRDLNRTYHDDAVPQTAAHKAILHNRHFLAASTLHEDYDATGAYVYEVQRPQRHKPQPWGEQLLLAASHHVPIDTRKSIEGRRATTTGLVRRSIRAKTMPLHPEAFTLHFEHADRTFTIETPSEYSIDARVDAHVAVVQRLIQLAQLDDLRGARASSPPS